MATYPEYRQFVGQRTTPSEGVRPAKSQQLQPTPSDIIGPFYTEGAPFVPNGRLCDNPTLLITGTVRGVDGETAKDAELDFWQADEKGEYDTDGFKFRGKVQASHHGHDGLHYELRTARPGDYKIADDPPDFRCAHIHVKVTAPGYKPLTTQLYFRDDKYNSSDHWFDPRRVIGDDGRFDFVLEKE